MNNILYFDGHRIFYDEQGLRVYVPPQACMDSRGHLVVDVASPFFHTVIDKMKAQPVALFSVDPHMEAILLPPEADLKKDDEVLMYTYARPAMMVGRKVPSRDGHTATLLCRDKQHTTLYQRLETELRRPLILADPAEVFSAALSSPNAHEVYAVMEEDRFFFYLFTDGRLADAVYLEQEKPPHEGPYAQGASPDEKSLYAMARLLGEVKHHLSSTSGYSLFLFLQRDISSTIRTYIESFGFSEVRIFSDGLFPFLLEHCPQKLYADFSAGSADIKNSRNVGRARPHLSYLSYLPLVLSIALAVVSVYGWWRSVDHYHQLQATELERTQQLQEAITQSDIDQENFEKNKERDEKVALLKSEYRQIRLDTMDILREKVSEYGEILEFTAEPDRYLCRIQTEVSLPESWDMFTEERTSVEGRYLYTLSWNEQEALQWSGIKN